MRLHGSVVCCQLGVQRGDSTGERRKASELTRGGKSRRFPARTMCKAGELHAACARTRSQGVSSVAVQVA